MKTLEELLITHAFFKDFSPKTIELMAGCGTIVVFDADQYLFHEGEGANNFYIIRYGTVALELHDARRGVIQVQTLGENDVLGWSWLFPPYHWHLSARAMSLVRATALDGQCVRAKCEADHDVGYEVMKQFAGIAIQRLQATRLQVLDVYS